MSRRTYYAALSGDPLPDPIGFALPPVRSVVLDRAEALGEDEREAATDGGAILADAADLEARLDAQEHPRAVGPEIRTLAEALARTPRVGK